ncbi:hypothetical protein [Methylorubrum extorquens]
MILRHDLDGVRLSDPDSPNVWVIYGGRRHRIESSNVYDALFSEVDRIILSHEIDEIEMGPELNDGTCLVRARGTLPVYLVTGFPHAKRHFIPTLETVLAFGFDLTKAHDIPAIVIDSIPMGEDLESASERVKIQRSDG